jgi:hypothetical protein
MSEDRGKLLYELKKTRSQRFVPIILTITFIFFVGILWPISFYFEQTGKFEPEKFTNFGIALIVILVIIISYMIYTTFWFFFHSYFLRIYEGGILINKRYENFEQPPPRTPEEAAVQKKKYRLLLTDHYIPLRNIEFVYALRSQSSRFEKSGYVILLENDGKWYMCPVPFRSSIDKVLDVLEKAFSGRWKRVFTGIYD